MPVNIVAEAAFRALMAFDRQMSSLPAERYLSDIYFVNIQHAVTRCMSDVFRHNLQLSLPGITLISVLEKCALDYFFCVVFCHSCLIIWFVFVVSMTK